MRSQLLIPADRQTNRGTYRVACMQLKMRPEVSIHYTVISVNLGSGIAKFYFKSV